MPLQGFSKRALFLWGSRGVVVSAWIAAWRRLIGCLTSQVTLVYSALLREIQNVLEDILWLIVLISYFNVSWSVGLFCGKSVGLFCGSMKCSLRYPMAHSPHKTFEDVMYTHMSTKKQPYTTWPLRYAYMSAPPYTGILRYKSSSVLKVN